MIIKYIHNCRIQYNIYIYNDSVCVHLFNYFLYACTDCYIYYNYLCITFTYSHMSRCPHTNYICVYSCVYLFMCIFMCTYIPQGRCLHIAGVLLSHSAVVFLFDI